MRRVMVGVWYGWLSLSILGCEQSSEPDGGRVTATEADSDPRGTGQDEEDCAELSVWHRDGDGDGYGDDLDTSIACTPPPGYVDVGGDCDDRDDSVHPGTDEMCDEIDNDCDGEVDEASASNIQCLSLRWPDSHRKPGLPTPGSSWVRRLGA